MHIHILYRNCGLSLIFFLHRVNGLFSESDSSRFGFSEFWKTLLLNCWSKLLFFFFFLRVLFYQKQPSADVLQNRFPQKYHNIHSKTPVLQSFFSNAGGLKAYNFIKKRLQRRCFPVNIAKSLGTTFFYRKKKFCFCFTHSRKMSLFSIVVANDHFSLAFFRFSTFKTCLIGLSTFAFFRKVG